MFIKGKWSLSLNHYVGYFSDFQLTNEELKIQLGLLHISPKRWRKNVFALGIERTLIGQHFLSNQSLNMIAVTYGIST